MSRANEIRDMVAVQLGRHRVAPEERLLEDLGAESADLVNLVAALEDRYRIEVGEEELAALRTVADVESLVAKLLEAGWRTRP